MIHLEHITLIIKLNLKLWRECQIFVIIVMHIYSWVYSMTFAGLAACGGNKNIKVVFKNCVPFTNCISEINNTQRDNSKNIDVVMPMYNSIE